MEQVKISFGIIVLNGEPFVRYNLRALYPFAHQIIVVEGAAPGARSIAKQDGHSTDQTLETLRRFKNEEDPDNKLLIVTAEDEGHGNGFWPGDKDEQSQAYAKRATGNYLWQVDVDEFYQPEAMIAVMNMLKEDPGITAVSFPTITFWGGLSYWVDGWYLRRGASVYHRLFMWGRSFIYSTHRPPTVLNADKVDTRKIHWVGHQMLAKKEIFMYHYSLLLPRQVKEKCAYYEEADWSQRKNAQKWAQESFLTMKHPFHVHNVLGYPGWLEGFSGTHPPQIRAMFSDIQEGRIKEELRRTDDIEKIVSSPGYILGRIALKILDYPDRLLQFCMHIFFRAIRKIRHMVGLCGFKKS